MRGSRILLRLLLAVLLAVSGGAQALATPPAASGDAAAERFIVRLRTLPGAPSYEPAPQRVAALAARHGLGLADARHIVAGMHLLRVAPRANEGTAQTLARLRADPEIEYAEVDERRHVLRTPDDSLFNDQWYLQSSQPSAVNAVAAWDLTSGSPGVVIADLDTACASITRICATPRPIGCCRATT